MRRLGGEDWALWLAERGIVALDEIDTRGLTLRSATPARCAGAVADERGSQSRRARAGARPADDGRIRARRQRVDPGAVRRRGGRRVSVAVVDYGLKRSILRRLGLGRRGVTVYPHVCDPDDLAGHDGVLLSNGPGDRRRSSRRPASCADARPGADARDLPRPPADGARDRARDDEAALRAPRRQPPRARPPAAAACSSRARTTGSRSSLRAGGGDARLALRRNRRGIRLPRAARAVPAVPSGGRPGAARCLADPRALGRGAR